MSQVEDKSPRHVTSHFMPIENASVSARLLLHRQVHPLDLRPARLFEGDSARSLKKRERQPESHRILCEQQKPSMKIQSAPRCFLFKYYHGFVPVSLRDFQI